MSRLTSLASLVAGLSLTLVFAGACGGQSFTSHGDDGGSTNGGSTNGGSTNGGSTNGGSGHAGSHTIGGSGQGGFAAAGAGGAVMYDQCSAPPETGQCEAAIQRWYHDPVSNQCLSFIYGGCGGNANNYGSLEACQAACGGGNPTACKLPSDCAIGPTSCCGVCDGPNVSASQLVAFNKQYAGQYLCGIALDTAPAPGGAGFPGPGVPVACPPCAAPLPGQGTLKYFVPDCVQGQCVVQDLRTSPLTACMSDQECRLRNGTGCCEGCAGTDAYVAVRNDGSFQKFACGGLAEPCPLCEAPAPNALAECGASGHCEVVYAAPTAQ
jgi:hypothetical protein